MTDCRRYIRESTSRELGRRAKVAWEEGETAIKYALLNCIIYLAG